MSVIKEAWLDVPRQPFSHPPLGRAMESHLVTPGPYRATKLWNEVTKYFRAGMPRRKHRQHFKKHGNCFTAAEAVDWLHELLRNNHNFGPEVTRQQTVQLLRKFLKNHVIEDIKGRWGSENLDDNNNLYRFPSASPVRSLPSRCPLSESTENVPKVTENVFKLPYFSRRTPKKWEIRKCQENMQNVKSETLEEDSQKTSHNKRLSQADVEEVWRNIILIHLQTILGISSLKKVFHPAQMVPQYIMYNMINTSKHGVVVLQDKSGPRSNDKMSQPTYMGFERDVFKTVADYFLSLPEPLLTFQYYELFVNILVLCGYITIPNRFKSKSSTWNDLELSKTPHLNSFKSTECLLLSLLHCETSKKDDSDASGPVFKKKDSVGNACGTKLQHYNMVCRHGAAHEHMGGSCQNLTRLKNEHTLPLRCKARCWSMEGITDTTTSIYYKDKLEILSEAGLQTMPLKNNENQLLHSGLMDLCSDNTSQNQSYGFKRVSALSIPDQELYSSSHKSKHLCRSLSLRGNSSLSWCGIHAPVAEITVKPHPVVPLRPKPQSTTRMLHQIGNEPGDSDMAIQKRVCQSAAELSKNATSPSSFTLTGTSSMLQPQLERVAIEALQICCLLLPPANRRKLQLLMRMISRISQNVDMPRLHDAVGTRSLMIQTFSRCLLCCEEEVDLDELLATRLVSFLMDHHQEILEVPTYLLVAVQDHIESLRTAQMDCLEEELSTILPMLPTYSYCKRITPQEFDEQKVSASQTAVAELLESIIKDRKLALKDKKKKLKQFQKEYPHIYQNRFPSTESEAILFEDKPTIKQPILSLKKPKFRSLRH